MIANKHFDFVPAVRLVRNGSGRSERGIVIVSIGIERVSLCLGLHAWRLRSPATRHVLCSSIGDGRALNLLELSDNVVDRASDH